MITIPEIIEMCMDFAHDEMLMYQRVFFLESCIRMDNRQSKKYAKRIVWCFISADMIYEGEYN